MRGKKTITLGIRVYSQNAYKRRINNKFSFLKEKIHDMEVNNYMIDNISLNVIHVGL